MSAPDPTVTLDELAELVRELTQQVRTLWQAVDDLREEIFAEFRHLRGEPLDTDESTAEPPYRLSSLPLDPCDPDFHQKVNTAQGAAAPTAATQPKSLEEFIGQLTSEPVAECVRSEGWQEDQPFPPGKVVEIDAELYDWLASSFAATGESAGCYILEDFEGCPHLLWSSDPQCFVRRLSVAEEETLTSLSDKTENSARSQPTRSGPESIPEPNETQGTLW